MKPIGYAIMGGAGPSGEPGVYYNYIFGANGVFIEAESPVIRARILVAPAVIRGLDPVETEIRLTYGSIPQRYWDLALGTFLADPEREHYVAVIARMGYHFYVPEQDCHEGKVQYDIGNNVILDLHSHANMPAFFSGQDNKDETGLKLYAVVGKLKETPTVRLRIGVYGYFEELSWNDVFDGSLTGAVEPRDIEEVIEANVHCDP